MPAARIIDGEGALSDWAKERRVVHHVNDGLRFIRLAGGTSGGHAAVSVAALLPDGSVAVLETTERLFIMAARFFAARSQAQGTLAPDLLESDGGDIEVELDGMTPEQLKKLRAYHDAQLDALNKKLGG